tara:strand:- start:27 stop:1901 length:1875 start_codon:yes stop_codon:yes gene_type:complete
MIFYKDESCFIIDTQEKSLPLSISSKLHFHGFKKKNKSIYQLDSIDLNIYESIINYFKEGDLSLEVDNELHDWAKRHYVDRKEFSVLTDYLRNYKDGIINQNDLIDFSSSLKKNNFKRELFDHQVKAALHLLKCKASANFSVPGSGKTTVVLSVFHYLRCMNEIDNIFVIGPLTCHDAWRKEYKECFGKDADVNIFAGGDIAYRHNTYLNNDYKQLNLSTFATVANDIDYLEKFMYKSYPLLVIDEAHYIKKEEGNWAQSIMRLSECAKYKVILTGTPMPQSFRDLFNLFDFLLCENSPFDSHVKRQIISLEESDSTEKIKNILDNKISPFFYRVRKKELKLPEQIIRSVDISMNEYEKKVYEFITSSITSLSQNDYLETIETRNRLKKGRMIRLRQVFSNISLLNTALEDYEEELFLPNSDIERIIHDYENLEKPAKLIKLLQLIDAHISKKEKVIIWSNFVKNVEYIESELSSKGIISKKIIGETPTENKKGRTKQVGMTRSQIVEDFNDVNGNIQVIIANPAACAESISLHKDCNNAIYYDLSYNTAQYLQSLDRIHRVGALNNLPSYYYILNYSDTVEKDIWDRVNLKAERMRAVMDTDYAVYELDVKDSSIENEIYRKL